MKLNGFARRPKAAAVCSGWLVGGVAVAMFAAPSAAAAPDCSGQGVANTVSSVTGAAQQYLNTHNGARQVLVAAADQDPAQAASNVRGYFTANPAEYYDLRGILAPIGDVQRTCNLSVLPPNLSVAYDQFMAG